MSEWTWTARAVVWVAVAALAGCTAAVEQQYAGQGAVQPAKAATGGSACAKDTDCKGERVCERGACVDPH